MYSMDNLNELINRKDKNGNNALIRAYLLNDIETVKLLVDLGININERANRCTSKITLYHSYEFSSYIGRTPLHLACFHKDFEMVKYFMENGANPDIQDDKGFTPLHQAVRWRELETIKLLLERKAKTSIKNNYGRTPLYYVDEKDEELKNLLLNNNR